MRPKIDDRNFDPVRRRVNNLDTFVAVPFECCPPTFMAANDFRDAAFQSRNVEIALAMDSDRLVVNQRAACQLRVQPDLPLAVRKRGGPGGLSFGNSSRFCAVQITL